MKTLSELKARELVWQYPEKADGLFVLSVDGEEVGGLRFDDHPGAESEAELFGQRWTFQHTRGPLPRVIIRREEQVAEFVPWLTGGGTLTFSDGRRYCWNRSSIWSPTWCFRLQGGAQKSSICVTQQAGPLRGGGRVRVCCDAAGLPETPLLILLAWYLRVVEFELLTDAIPVIG